MKNCILYFSGTGNSLKVAMDIAYNLGDCEVLPIARHLTNGINNAYERIGFAFPVYAWGPPNIVLDFIDKSGNNMLNTYVYAIATYRNEPGAALTLISNILRSKGLKLNSGFGVHMPGNHIANYDIDSELLMKNKFEQWNSQLHQVVSVIKEKKENGLNKPSLIDKYYKTGFLYKIASGQFSKWDINFKLNNNCNGCGVCNKICPVKNIDIIENRPVWKHNCEQCLACLHWCPKLSIEYGDKTKGKKRYHHPDIAMKNMFV